MLEGVTYCVHWLVLAVVEPSLPGPQAPAGAVLIDIEDNSDLEGSARQTLCMLLAPAYFDDCCLDTAEGFEACLEGLLAQPCAGAAPNCS
ncbi:MAG: hypothetical protein R3A51_02535 [Nannocystaceae bacterium]